MYLTHQQSFGEVDSEVIANTTERTGKNYAMIECVGDTVIESMTTPGMTGNSGLCGVTFTDGRRFYFPITAIKLTSGKVIAYNRAKG